LGGLQRRLPLAAGEAQRAEQVVVVGVGRGEGQRLVMAASASAGRC